MQPKLLFAQLRADDVHFSCD